MSSSQVNFGRLTARKNDIECELSRLAMQKMAITRDITAVTNTYQAALNSKVLKWSSNAGVTYSDLSYKTLMKPGAANKNKPYLITNASDQVVLDQDYAKYAAMISPDGAPGGDWKSNRTKILSELTGVSEDKINTATEKSDAVAAAAQKINNLKDYQARKLKEPVNNDTASAFFKRAGLISANGTAYDLGRLYNSSDVWQNFGNSANAQASLTTLLDGLANNMRNFLPDDDYEKFKAACQGYMQENGHFFTGTSDAEKRGLENGTAGIKKSGDNFTINIKTVLDQILGSYKSAASSAYTKNSLGTEVFFTRDMNSAEWNNWRAANEDWKNQMKAAEEEYKAAQSANNQVFLAEEESNIKFYDQLFTAIAEKGWVELYEVNDNDYLNNMLQNNMLYITTLEEQDDDGDGITSLEYNTDIASNMDNIFSVNDSNAQTEALVKYEHDKAILNEKESRIDVRMKNLNTELSATNNMLDSVKTVRNDNIEQTLNLYS